MRRGIMIALGVLVVLGVVVAGYAYFSPQIADAMERLLAAPAGLDAAAPAAPVVAESRIVAEAVVVPVQYAALSMPASGTVAEILVVEGASVEAGEVLARLKSDREVIAVARAQAATDQAHAQVDLLINGARAEELQAAQAAIDAAQAQVEILTQGPHAEDVAAAQAALAATQAQYGQVAAGADDQELIAARADMANAEAAMTQAQRAYDEVAWRSDIGTLPQSAALQTATNEYEAALARYEDLAAGAEPSQLAEVAALIDQARAQLERLQAPPTENEVAASEAAVRQAQASYDLIAAGARSEEIAMAESDLSAAEAELMQAQLALADRELRAPFGGVLASIDLKIGQEVIAGAPVAQLADQTAWLVETTDLTEISVVDVQEGDPVSIAVDALPDVDLTGRVISIKPLGENILGDITYKVTVQLDEDDPRLRWNMTAAATIEE